MTILKKSKCCLCGDAIVGGGHNPAPLSTVKASDKCCGDCNDTLVVPFRISLVMGNKKL